MKSTTTALLAVAVALLLTTSNPDRATYTTWAKDQALAQNNNAIVRAGISLLGPAILDATTTAKDHKLFTIFETETGNTEPFRALGIAGQILPLPLNLPFR